MFASGDFVAQYIEPHGDRELSDDQIQPVGVELTVDKVLALEGPCRIGTDDYVKNNRYEKKPRNQGTVVDNSNPKDHATRAIQEIEPSKHDAHDFDLDVPHYTLIRGVYVVVYEEEITIPEGYVGFVKPRSRLLRTGNHLTTAVWEPGYSGRGEGSLQVGSLMFLEHDARIGQIVFAEQDTEHAYEGTHQAERLK